MYLVSFKTLAQDFDWRIISGELSYKGEPMIGENVMIIGVPHGTVTDKNGRFCLLVPKEIPVYISIPQCFDSVVRLVDESTTDLNIKLNKRNSRLTKRASEKWLNDRLTLEPKLKKCFAAINYQSKLAEKCN